MGRPVKRKGFSWFTKTVMPALPTDTILLLIGPKNTKPPVFLNYLPQFLKKQVEVLFSMASDAVDLSTAVQLPTNHNRVFILGKLPFKEVQQLLKLADLFIMPNRSISGDMEGFGLVGLEAAMAGTPVVAAGIEGITNAIQDGENGYLLPPEKPKVWVKKINEILAMPETLHQFSQQVQAYTIGQFSWAKMAKSYEAILEKKV